MIVLEGDGDRIRPSREFCEFHEYGDSSIISCRLVEMGLGAGARTVRGCAEAGKLVGGY